MKEVISAQLGQCGNQIGCRFWEMICDEHVVSPTGLFSGNFDIELGSIETYFSETPYRRYVPRAVLVDLEAATLDTCRCSPYGHVFRPDNFIFGRSGAGNNWAKGHYTEGLELMEMTLEAIRKEAELCESLSGFQMLHSLGGGTGSGMGSLLLEKIVDEYSHKIITTYTVFPSALVSDTNVEPYNTTLSIPSLMDNSNLTICYDNEALYKICGNVLKIQTPSFYDLNTLISNVASGMTCCMRFPGTTNVSLRKLKTMLTPYPHLHFFVPGYSPLSSRGVQPYRSFSLQDILQQILSGKTLMASVHPKNGKYVTAAMLCRGLISEGLLEDILCNFQSKNSDKFTPCLPNYMVKGVCNIPPRGMNSAATFLVNNTCVSSMWKRMREGFHKLLERKAHLHWYYGEGMSMSDFTEAEVKVNKLIEEYDQYERQACKEKGEMDTTKKINNAQQLQYGSDKIPMTFCSNRIIPAPKRKPCPILLQEQRRSQNCNFVEFKNGQMLAYGSDNIPLVFCRNPMPAKNNQ